MRRAIALLGTTILLGALLPLFAPSASAQDLTVSIRPAVEHHRAVRGGLKVLVSGEAPAGARVTDVRAVGFETGTGRPEQLYGPSVLNRSEAQAGTLDYIHVDDSGRLTGRMTLNCVFNHPGTFCLTDRGTVAEMALRVTVDNQVTRESNRLRVDFTPPVITHYELVQPNRIKVWFSEPVHHPDGGGDRRDWQVSNAGTPLNPVVLQVEGPTANDCDHTDWPAGWEPRTGCSRTLVLNLQLDEDATPRVQHPLAHADYRDFADNVLTRAANWGGQNATSDALDRIRPPLPKIEAVGGTAPDEHGRTTGESRSPTVTVGNLRAGHVVHFLVEGEAIHSEVADGSSDTFQLPNLGSGDEFNIQAVVTDPAGNKSTDGHLHTVRADSGPSVVCYGVGSLCFLPTLPGPKVLEPASELYTRSSSPTVSGVVEPAQAGIEVQLRDRLTGGTLGRTTTGEDGSWSFATSLDLQRRYRFEVRTVDGDRTVEARVPDIVLDTTNPALQVLRPAPDPTQVTLQSNAGDLRPRRYQGDVVDIAWLATDLALLDPDNPDHGSHVDIDIVYADQPDAPQPAARELDYTALLQGHGYTISGHDLLGRERQATFDVTVTDLAGNQTSGTSYPIVIDGTKISFERWFVQHGEHSLIQARFPISLQGTTTPAEWRIDGQIPTQVTRVEEGGRTILVLEASQAINDPNARPEVAFIPLAVNPDPLRGTDGREITTGTRPAEDKIAPALSLTRIPDPGPRAAESVTVSGRTDQTETVNTVRAFRNGAAVGQTPAAKDGQFSLTVPLDPDRVNQITIRAVDPASNVSPDQVFEVIEDSTPPVVVIDNPVANTAIPRSLPIRWHTVDNNPEVVDIDYRVGSGEWQSLVRGAPDTGTHRWQIPASIPDEAVLGLRITATDKAGHRGQPSTVTGLALTLPSLLDGCKDVGPAPFADRDAVPAVHRRAVDCLYALGIAKGTPRDGRLYFLPQNDISRGQFSGFLYRTMGVAQVELPAAGDRFDDVPAGHTFDADIHRLAAAEVILGYDARRFGPADPIKRDQTAALLLRALGYMRDETLLAEATGYFADTTSSVHRSSIDAAFEHGLVVGRTAPSGASPGIYDPGSLTTRAQMATVLVRALTAFED